LLAWYSHLLKFLKQTNSDEEIIVHTLLVDYCEDKYDALAEELDKFEFTEIPGHIHIQVFQILLDAITELESFRSYLNEILERRGGLV
jgi:hypothetical protein